MDYRKNNIFVAFALWAGAGILLRITEFLSFEFYLAILGQPEGHVPITLAEWPVLAGFLAVLIIARAWRGNITLLITVYAASDIIWTILTNANVKLYLLLCPAGVCLSEYTYNFHVKYTALEFMGYILAAIIVLATRSGKVPDGQARKNLNPLDYIAKLLAQLTTELCIWLEIDSSSIARTWSRWAALPLWRSGAFFSRVFGSIWVPFFGLAAASLLTNTIYLILSPFWNMVINDLSGEEAWKFIVFLAPLLLLNLIMPWAVGSYVSSLGRSLSAWAAIPAVLLASFSTIQSSIFILTQNQLPLSDIYRFHIQNLGVVMVLYIGFLIGHQRAPKKKKLLEQA
ncbi:MAG: hypothetical protein COB37_01605 [Kordiimonadales bacterium]|nr:MAG: hypothetical protein COB37_01605 [Kordiimonadales bacterium]